MREPLKRLLLRLERPIACLLPTTNMPCCFLNGKYIVHLDTPSCIVPEYLSFYKPLFAIGSRHKRELRLELRLTADAPGR